VEQFCGPAQVFQNIGAYDVIVDAMDIRQTVFKIRLDEPDGLRERIAEAAGPFDTGNFEPTLGQDGRDVSIAAP
jgi:hypothetical protein